MASNVSDRVGFIIAGGVLSIVAGVIEVLFGGPMLASAVLGIPFELRLYGAYRYNMLFEVWVDRHIAVDLPWLIIVGVPLIVLGIISIVGGISAIRRKRFGLSLAGAVCALPCALGILAIVFISHGKEEFEVDI